MLTRTMIGTHTPGPWQVKRIPDGFVLKQEGGHGKYLFNLEECPGIPEAKANARLIAAAPDLLAALKHAQEALLWYGAMNFEMDGKLVCDVVTDAIAKAEGKS